MIRSQVRPGVTGLAQISGRNQIRLRQRVTYDIAYAKGVSFALDTSLLVKTLLAVVLRRDIHQSHDAFDSF